MDPKPHIGLVGCGRWGRHILRDLKSIGCTVTVVAPSADSRSNAVAGDADGVVERVDELGSLDGYVVATPTLTHVAVVEHLLGLGPGPVYCEKPLAVSPAAVEGLAAAAPDRLFVMHKWRYHPGVVALGEIARSTEFGDVIGLHSVRSGWGTAHYDVDGLWVLLPHEHSIALEVLGEIPPVRAAVADVVGGEGVGLRALAGSDPWWSLDLDGRSPHRDRVLTLFTGGATITLGSAYDDHLTIMPSKEGFRDRAAPEPEKREIPTDMPLLLELQAFVAHVTGGPPPKSSVHEAVTVTRAIAAMRAAAGLPEGTT